MPHTPPTPGTPPAPVAPALTPDLLQQPTPTIGQTIDDEGPSKTKQFLTDPKNLATMLVLASALAQPKRGGRSNLAHTLRAGTGALAFRGGLTRQIDLQREGAAEGASVIQDRQAQQRLSGERTDVLESQVLATERGQDIGVTEGVLDRESAEQISADRLAALVGRERLENELIKIGLEGYYKAYSDYLLTGAVGSPPDPLMFVPLPEGMTIGPLDSGQDIIVPSDPENAPLATPIPTTPTADADTTEAVPFAPTVISGVPVTGHLSRAIKKSSPAENVKVSMLRVARKRYPEIYKDATDEEIFNRITSIQQDIKARLAAGMSQEEARTLKADRFMIEHMTREQRSEVLKLAKGTPPTPRATTF